ncbi:hypothetical protein KIMH_08510 [Bombiscardovia apis]|uniref:Phosphoribosylglycinamide synthetase n=1 Tax=Bombiscardovia apis TaxID=2932182 RepID=A0ABN6SJ54_9BIFI|nr:phosphoribosylglycinamide synthetase [Bombiscardovia apis]BDR54740.1 hypothetical protein KIMH_08510 [Bombiscardovia apis]
MNENVEELKAKEAGNPKIWLRVASERLSQLRYVYLVQIEDGIPTADQRACLEYADAVLIGWPDEDAEQVVDLDEVQLDQVRKVISEMEDKIPLFRKQECDGEIDQLSQTLVMITECVAQVRRHYQPDFPLPTYQEIHQVVQQEWNEDMSRIDPDQVTSPEEVKEMQEASSEVDLHTHVGTGLSANLAAENAQQNGNEESASL